MKCIKVLIWIILMLIISVIIAMLVVKNMNTEGKTKNVNILTSDNNDEELSFDDIGDLYDEDYSDGVVILTNKNSFFSIEKMIQTYFIYLKSGNIEAVYSILDNSYLTANGANKENVLEKARQGLFYDGNYIAKEIYIKDSQGKPNYYISGILEKDSSKMEIYLTLYKDIKNDAYSLKPINSQEYILYTSSSQTENHSEDIQKNDYNKIINVSLEDEEIARKYFERYINDARYYPQDAYNTLDEEYKKLKFGSFENYQKYLISKSSQLESLDVKAIKEETEFASEEDYISYIQNIKLGKLEKYSLTMVGDTTYCKCIDTYDNYYIFKATGVMNYKLLLDIYTVDLPEFLEQYKEATTEEKGELNIQKIFEAINEKDYKYVYNKLEPTYRATVASDYETFKSYMMNNLFEKNVIEFEDYTENNNDLIYKITITDETENNQNEIKMIINMKLGENTEFSIKFE